MMNNTQTSIKEKYHELLSKINWELVFQNLGLKPENKGNYLEIVCPKCGKKEAFFYLNTDSENHNIICNRKNKCAFKVHILEYLNNGLFPRGDDWKKSVEKLAILSGTPITLESKFPVKSQSLQKERYIIKDYWKFLQDQFPNSPAEKYIVENRKLDPTKTTFGYVPEDVDELMSWAKGKGYSEEMLLKCGIITRGSHGKFISLRGRLAGAFIDQMGNVHNIWGRDITENPTENRKYINLKDSEFTHKKGPYGAELFKGGIVVWVEGYLDVAATRECGIVAVASGTSSIPEDMAQSLRGLHTIITALDNDGAGEDGTFRFIEKNVNNEVFKIFSINKILMKGCKDISDLYRKHGKEAVKDIFFPDNLEHSFTIAQRYILAKNKNGETWTPVSKENALEAASAFDKRVVASSKIPLFQDYFWKNGIQQELGLDEKALESHIEDLQQKKEKASVKSQIEKYAQQSKEKASAGDLKGAFEDIEKLHACINKYQNPYYKIEPYTIYDLERDLENSSDGFKTGYQELDEMVRIQSEAITLVAGRPSHGKTTFMMNMFLNMIEEYPKMSFYFFSYEETCQQIAIKIINILSKHVINESQNLLQLQGYIRGRHKEIEEIEKGKKKFQDLVGSGRLRIIGQPLFVQNFSATISHLCSKESVGVIFIDYIQKIKSKDKFFSRQLEIQKTSEIILEMAKSTSIPVVLGAQLGRDQNSKEKVRLDNLREAGDLEQDANVVLGIYNPSMENSKQSHNPLTKRVIGISVTPLKNRNGIANKEIALEFDRPILKITDKKR